MLKQGPNTALNKGYREKSGVADGFIFLINPLILKGGPVIGENVWRTAPMEAGTEGISEEAPVSPARHHRCSNGLLHILVVILPCGYT